MDHTKDIMDVVKFFQYTFIIVFALALGEAFKQFVAEKANQPPDKVVDWGRLPALLSFVVLIFPFYQGMSRYFFATYADVSTLPKPYSLYLMFDGVAFLAESALFLSCPAPCPRTDGVPIMGRSWFFSWWIRVGAQCLGTVTAGLRPCGSR